MALVGIAIGLALWVGTLQSAALPILWGVGFAAAAIAVLVLARRLAGRSALAAAALLAGFTTADLAWNNAPHESTGLPPAEYEALRPDTDERNRRADQAKLRPPPRPTIATASN